MDRRATVPGSALDLTVAGVRLAFRGEDGLALAAPGFEYPPFLGPLPWHRQLAIRVHAGPRPAIPGAARVLFDTGDAWQLLGLDDHRWLRMSGAPGCDGSWQLHWRGELEHARAWVSPHMIRGTTVHHLTQYPLDQILLTRALARDGALLLHAAGGRTPGAGIAFAGVSGAGKSTLTRLLSPLPGFRFASDDRLVAAPSPDGYTLHGTPWAGDARVAAPDRSPLHALCFLRQAGAPALEPLGHRDALERLLAVCTLPWYDAHAVGAALEAAGRLVSRVPCFELACSLDAGAVAAVLSGLDRAA